MEGNYEHPFDEENSSDPVSIELFSKQKLNMDIKATLSSNITSKLPQPKDNVVLVIGAKVGATAQLLLPHCKRIDMVAQKSYIPVLEARFNKGQNVEYFFQKEGLLGEKHVLPKPQINNCEINIVEISQFHEKISKQNTYNIVLLQNVLITPQINIIKELMSLEHQMLITMLVPGKITHDGLFQLLSGLQVNILNVFYEQISHQTIQYNKYLTGRRQEINFWEVFVWKRKNFDNPKKQLQAISQILQNEIKTHQIVEIKKKKGAEIYQSEESVQQYLDFHYGETDYFGIKNFPKTCAQKCIAVSEKFGVEGRALDLGCAVGRSVVQLAKKFKEVKGVEYSKAFTETAKKYVNAKYENERDKVQFIQGDACNLNKDLGKFDLIFGGNLLDRLYDPEAFLRQVAGFMSDKSLLILTSPYTWMKDYTPKEKWIGGKIEDGKEVSTYGKLKEILESEGLKEAIPCEDVPFVIKDNLWVYQYTSANMSFWLKE